MMKVNDFQKYEVTLSISYEDYFRLIYDTKYLIEARLGPDRTFIARKSVYGNSRKKAVQKAVQWFWKDFKGVLGPAHKVMTVNDPFDEVNYHDGFACNDLANKYLEEGTIIRNATNTGQLRGECRCASSPFLPPRTLQRRCQVWHCMRTGVEFEITLVEEGTFDLIEALPEVDVSFFGTRLCPQPPQCTAARQYTHPPHIHVSLPRA